MKEGKICRQGGSQHTGHSDKLFCSDQSRTMAHHAQRKDDKREISAKNELKPISTHHHTHCSLLRPADGRN